MPHSLRSSARSACALAAFLTVGNCLAATDLQTVVDASVKPLMQQQAIAGLAVGVVQDGKAHYFNYGVASTDARQPVSEHTLFEIGSVSKTFTATLAGYAVASGQLKLSAPASHYLPALRGGKFDHVLTCSTSAPTPLAACPCNSRRRPTITNA